MRRYFSHGEGYVRLKINGKFVLEHRKVMEDYLGRPLDAHEVVHHLNSNVQDNRIENLAILNSSEHSRCHAQQRQSEHYVTLQCPTCGRLFQRKKGKHRWAQLHNHKEHCSRTCSGNDPQRPHGAAA